VVVVVLTGVVDGLIVVGDNIEVVCGFGEVVGESVLILVVVFDVVVTTGVVFEVTTGLVTEDRLVV